MAAAIAMPSGLEEGGGWSRPRRRLMALLNGTCGLPVTDPDKAKALKPFGQVQAYESVPSTHTPALRQGDDPHSSTG